MLFAKQDNESWPFGEGAIAWTVQWLRATRTLDSMITGRAAALVKQKTGISLQVKVKDHFVVVSSCVVAVSEALPLGGSPAPTASSASGKPRCRRQLAGCEG